MASALAQQLEAQRRKFVTPSNSRQGAQQGSGTRCSLLFEKHEAADYDANDIYQLGLSGLKELVARHGAEELEDFRDTLFSATAAEMERHLQSQELNEELTKTLDKFIESLSPFLMLKSAQKVLEYLVRQFEVHAHNVNALVLSCMPYHDTELFVKVLCLPVAVARTKWAFLGRVQQTKEPVSREQLVKVCSSHVGVLNAVCKMACEHNHNSSYVTFMAVLVSQVIERAAKDSRSSATDRIKVFLDTRLVPNVIACALEAMRSRANPDFQRAGFLLATCLAQHIQLSDKAGKLLLLGCLKKPTRDNLPGALKCAAVILQFTEVDAISPKLVAKLCKRFGTEEERLLAEAFRKAFGSEPVAPSEVSFVNEFALRAIEADESQGDASCGRAMEGVLQVCTPVTLKRVMLELANRIREDSVPAKQRAGKKTRSKSLQDSHRALACLLANQRPDDVDQLFRSVKVDSTEHASLVAMSRLSFADQSSLAGLHLLDGGPDGDTAMGDDQSTAACTTIRIALHHHSPSMRRQALDQLAKSDATWASMDAAILLDRVEDSDIDVVAAACRLLKSFLRRDDALPASISATQIASAIRRALQIHACASPVAAQDLEDILAVVESLVLDEGGNVMIPLVAAMLNVSGTETAATLGVVLHAVGALAKGNARTSPARAFAALANQKSAKLTLKNLAAHLSKDDEALVQAVQLADWSLKQELSGTCSLLAEVLALASPAPAAVDTAVRLALAPHLWLHKDTVDMQRLGKVLLSIQLDIKRDSLTPDQIRMDHEQLPLALGVLHHALGACDDAYRVACVPFVQQVCMQLLDGCLLQTLLMFCTGAVEGDEVRNQVVVRRSLVLCTALIRGTQDAKGKHGLHFLEATPFVLHALRIEGNASSAVRDAAVDCCAAILESAAFSKAYLGPATNAKSSKKARVVVEVLPEGDQGQPAEVFQCLLKRIVEARKEFLVDPETLGRVMRSVSSENPSVCEAVFERVTHLVEACPLPLAATHGKGGEQVFSMPRALRNIMDCVVQDKPEAAVLGSVACADVTMAMLEYHMPRPVRSMMSAWARQGQMPITPRHVEVLLAGLSIPSMHELVLKPLQAKHIFEHLSAQDRDAAFGALCGLAEHGEDGELRPSLSTDAIAAFGKLPFEGSIYRKRLESASSATTKSATALSRSKLDKAAPRVVVLEAIRARLFGESDDVLLLDVVCSTLAGLFEVMGNRKEPEKEDEQLLVLVCLSQSMQALVEASSPTNDSRKTNKSNRKKASSTLDKALMSIDLEAIVSAVLKAKSPSLRNAGLELLTHTTRLFPHKVVRIVLPVLKMASSSTLAPQASEANAQMFVVLEHVTRCLASAVNLSQDEADQVDVVAHFVESLSQSDQSARVLDLLELLVQSYGSDGQVLWVVITLLLREAASRSEGNNIEQQSWLAQQLLFRFSIQVQILTMVKLFEHFHLILCPQDTGSPSEDHTSAIDVLVSKLDGDNEDGFDRFVLGLGLCSTLSAHLSSREFMRLLSALPAKEMESADMQGERGFLGLLNHLHRQIHFCGKQLAKTRSKAENRTVSAIRDELCTVLDKISALLSVPVFVAVVQDLLQDEDAHIRHLAIRQLSAKVEQQHASWRTEEVVIFLEMVGNLQGIINDSSESDVNKQTTLLSIDVLAQTLGPRHPKAFLDVLKPVVAELERLSAQMHESVTVAQVQVTSSAALCVGTLVKVLKELALPRLPSIGKSLFSCFKQFKRQDRDALRQEEAREMEEEKSTSDSDNDEDSRTSLREARLMLAQSATTSIQVLISELPQYLSPFLDDLLLVAGASDAEDIPQATRVAASRVGEKIAAHMEPRLLMRPLTRRFELFVRSKNTVAAENLLGVLALSIDAMPREVVAAQFSSLVTFFVLALDVRCMVLDGKLAVEALEEHGDSIVSLEEAVGECLLSLVLKLSGRQMKQLFGALVDKFASEDGVASGLAVQSTLVEGDGLFDSLNMESESEEGRRARKRKAPSSTSAAGSQRWIRQGRAATLYLICEMLGEQLMGLSVPFLERVLKDVKWDLLRKIDPETRQGSHDGDEEDAESRSSGSGSSIDGRSSSSEGDDSDDDDEEGDDDQKRTVKRRRAQDKNDHVQAVQAVTQSVEQRVALRLQQRCVRERAAHIVGLYCDHSTDALAQASEQDSVRQEFLSLFDALMTCMDIDHHALEGDGEEDATVYFEEFVQRDLAPCVVKLARSVNDDTLWQTLHHGLLEFAKHASAAVRRKMLDTLVMLFEEVGEAYIVLLADTLPTIAELLEDKDPEVKRTAHRSAKKLQQLSGEDLSSFLR
ncbi:HEAT repeat-containing protein 1 (Protein BAP28) (Fragment) [Durusdinium trenchii]|uniref:HEAT repeat-containing protein 1 n=1 Tax=Durusdinium trenchii TaxID=1381693 RepID=A0ABP0HYY0_9DINO